MGDWRWYMGISLNWPVSWTRPVLFLYKAPCLTWAFHPIRWMMHKEGSPSVLMAPWICGSTNRRRSPLLISSIAPASSNWQIFSGATVKRRARVRLRDVLYASEHEVRSHALHNWPHWPLLVRPINQGRSTPRRVSFKHYALQ